MCNNAIESTNNQKMKKLTKPFSTKIYEGFLKQTWDRLIVFYWNLLLE